VTHDELGIKLPDGIEHDPDDDQEGCTTEQLVAAHSRNEWQDGHNAQNQIYLTRA
jgi:hypothetical protein